jgi:hypothetical protein
LLSFFTDCCDLLSFILGLLRFALIYSRTAATCSHSFRDCRDLLSFIHGLLRLALIHGQTAAICSHYSQTAAICSHLLTVCCDLLSFIHALLAAFISTPTPFLQPHCGATRSRPFLHSYQPPHHSTATLRPYQKLCLPSFLSIPTALSLGPHYSHSHSAALPNEDLTIVHIDPHTTPTAARRRHQTTNLHSCSATSTATRRLFLTMIIHSFISTPTLLS